MIVAAGVWTNALTDAVTLRPSRGSHLLIRAERLGDPRAMVSVKVPGERGRWVFAIPRGDGLVAIGLTDVDAPGEPADEPRPTAAEEDELLHRASAALDVPLGPGDVVGRYAGLRPLRGRRGEGATADLSRRHAIVEDPASGALAIVGGKLTTYRRMAQDVVDRITDRPCRTARLPLVGAAAPARWRRWRRRSGSCAGTGPRRPPWWRWPTGGPSCSSRSATACRRAAPSCCGRCGTSWR